MKKLMLRRAFLCGAVALALMFSPAASLDGRADDGTGYSTPGKTGKHEPVDESALDLLLDALESLCLLLPV